MAILRSNGTTTSTSSVSSAAARTASAANLSTYGVSTLADTTTEGKTPDYHLPWTGAVVEETLRKAMEMDPSEMGGVIVLESTYSTPANIDAVLDPGNYVANYMTATGFPSELEGVIPVNVSVFLKDGILYQVVEGMGDKFARYSKDSGATWSVFSPKSTNSGGIDTSGSGEDPTPDPVEELEDRVNSLETLVANGVSVGTEEVAQAMLDGTYDYDTGTITGT